MFNKALINKQCKRNFRPFGNGAAPALMMFSRIDGFAGSMKRLLNFRPLIRRVLWQDSTPKISYAEL
jgi:hypothetical protein